MSKQRRAQRFSGQNGVSVVEAPLVLIVIAFVALGALAFVQIFISYQHLSSATRSAARYASKADYDPSQANPKWNTRPNTTDVQAYAQKAAPEFDPSKTTWNVAVCQTDDTTCPSAANETGTPAEHVHVKGTATLDDGPYTLISGLVNGLSSFFGGDAIPPKIKIHSEAVAAYE
jgi:Tfp pilus assembly protein PilV